jgi:hypothetical protein
MSGQLIWIKCKSEYASGLSKKLACMDSKMVFLTQVKINNI